MAEGGLAAADLRRASVERMVTGAITRVLIKPRSTRHFHIISVDPNRWDR
jgi:hypothetical protein